MSTNETKTSSVERAAVYLRKQIVQGRLRPGDHIRVSKLASEVGVSHIPFREAMRQLEGERLLRSEPNRGAVVTELRLDDCNNIYDLRELLEPHVASQALGKFTGGAAQRLVAAHRRLEAHGPAAHDEAMWAAHTEFHEALLVPGMNAWSHEFLRVLWQASDRYRRLVPSLDMDFAEAFHSHGQLVDMALAGDAALPSVVETHLEHARAVVVGGLSSGAVPLDGKGQRDGHDEDAR